MLDLLRDRRTIISSFVLPVILYPLIMIGFSAMMTRQETKLQEKEATIYIRDHVTDESSREIIEAITALPTFHRMETPAELQSKDLVDMLQDNSLQAALEIADSTMENGSKVYLITVQYNKTDDASNLVYGKIYRAVKDAETSIVANRLNKIQVDSRILQAVDIIEENVAPPEKMVGFALGKFLPYLLIILTVSAASVIASDLVAGEKERGTLETILVSAARRNELVMGKYLTIITISIITVLLNIFSMYFSFSHIMGQAGEELKGLSLPLGNFALILLLMLPLITFFSAILLSISTYSRNIKEAQSYQMPLVFASIMLSMVSFLPGFELNTGFALIPIVNFSLMIRDIMLSDFKLFYFLLIIGYTVVLDVILILLSSKLFNSENVLFRTSEEKSLKFWGKGKQNVFSTQFMMMIYFVLLLALYYIGTDWQVKDIMSGLVKTEIIIVLLPIVLLLRLSKNDLKTSLSLHKTNPANYLVALLGVIPALIIVAIIAQLINLIFPFSESYLKAMQKLLTADSGTLWNSLFIIGILPGICEEVFFRGYIFHGFRKYGKWQAIVITGILFGIFHLDPFRLVPASLLGIWMGYLLLKTDSIFVPMLAHAANNSFSILVNSYAGKVAILKLFEQETLPYWYVIPAGLILVLVMYLLNVINRNKANYMMNVVEI